MTHVFDLFKLDGKVALVTGGSRGLGLAMAEGLAEAGAKLAICGVDPDRVEATAKKLRDRGHECVAIQADVSNEADVRCMVETVESRYGRCDILVNNAGVAGITNVMDMHPDMWKRILDVNLTGTFLCSRAVGRLMLAQRSGSIINLSSENGQVGFPGMSAYATTKIGLVGFTRSLAVEWGRAGIRVNAILPGNMQEGMMESLQDKNSPMYQYAGEALLRMIPEGSFGTANDVKGTVVFLASEAARYVTGAQIVVDGGFTINAMPVA